MKAAQNFQWLDFRREKLSDRFLKAIRLCYPDRGRIFGKEAGGIPAHEFHYYDSEICGEAFLAEKPMSNRSWKCMISTDTVLAGYPHIHYYGNEKIPENFLEQCRRCREQEKRARERDRT